MSYRTIALSPDETSLFVTSEYNDEIRFIIKSFRGATWNSQRKVWMIPLEHAGALADALSRFDFRGSDRVKTSQTGEVSDGSPSALSVSELTSRVSLALARAFPDPLWVKGELSSYDKGTMRRHLYFELVEKTPGQDEINARLAAVIFHRNRAAIERRLANAPEPFHLRDGLNVQVHGRVVFSSSSTMWTPTSP